MKAHERIILPVDVSNVSKAQELINLLLPRVGVFKFGFEVMYSMMADLILTPEQDIIRWVRKIRSLCRSLPPSKTFIDGKLADIDKTVGRASAAISRLQARMFNVHASAGQKAIRAAVANKGISQVYGVTVLTSIDPDECKSIFGDEPAAKVVQFAGMLFDNGADGIICAPKEGLILRKLPKFARLRIATPNVRPLWAMTAKERERTNDCQSIDRQLTPASAMEAGINELVIGSPITDPPREIGGPVKAAQLIAEEIASVTGEEV